MRVRYSRFGDDVADWAEGVEALRYGPWESLLLCFVLDIAAGEVDRDEVAWHA